MKSAKVLKEHKKKKFRKVYLCLAAVLVILVIVVLLLFHRPADYNRPQAIPAGKEAGKQMEKRLDFLARTYAAKKDKQTKEED